MPLGAPAVDDVELEPGDALEDSAQALAVGVTPWAPEVKDRWVRIEVTEIGGRTFKRGRPAAE